MHVIAETRNFHKSRKRERESFDARESASEMSPVTRDSQSIGIPFGGGRGEIDRMTGN